jgi:hypothetical protein
MQGWCDAHHRQENRAAARWVMLHIVRRWARVDPHIDSSKS